MLAMLQQDLDHDSYMKKEASPIKVKDYFANPVHRIRQPCFVEVGFTQSHLNTFVKAFTNRYLSRYISFTAIRQFITSFTNNNAKLIQIYEDFFLHNFSINEHGDILLEQFVNFFTKDQGKTVESLSEREKKRIFHELGELSSQNILAHSKELGLAMKDDQARKIVKMLNLQGTRGKAVSQQAFLKALSEAKIIQ